jgi:hypothetical protein
MRLEDYRSFQMRSYSESVRDLIADAFPKAYSLKVTKLATKIEQVRRHELSCSFADLAALHATLSEMLYSETTSGTFSKFGLVFNVTDPTPVKLAGTITVCSCENIDTGSTNPTDSSFDSQEILLVNKLDWGMHDA